MKHLVDGDLQPNNGGCSGPPGLVRMPPRISGCLTQPHRVKKFDPEGSLSGNGFPELERVPTSFIHHPCFHDAGDCKKKWV
jgi:deoxyribodipyrimidine photolyase